MRPIPAPRTADARPMPHGNSRDWVVHPGPDVTPRFSLIGCNARAVKLSLRAGTILLDAVAAEVENAGADGACVILDGVSFSTMNYVMPDGPIDDTHAAWYSDTHQVTDAKLDQATASVGRKDGAWFMHTHAMWSAPVTGMGHLLNEQCTLAKDIEVTAWLVQGARLDVVPDPETQFPLFRPEKRRLSKPVQAALLTIRPHQDLRKTIEAACAEMGFVNASVHGLGSLIGAAFKDTPAMTASLSEVLLLQGCAIRDAQCSQLPLACVDPEGGIFQGDLVAGQGPVCVTFELLIVAK